MKALMWDPKAGTVLVKVDPIEKVGSGWIVSLPDGTLKTIPFTYLSH